MEAAAIELDDAALFDQLVHGGLPEGGDLRFVVKPGATEGGRPAVCISFTVRTPDGQRHLAQAVTTARMMQTLGEMLTARYGRL